MEKRKIVFVLGAGAAQPGGCPVMSSFFQCAETLYQFDQLDQFKEDYEAIASFRLLLTRSHGRSNADIDNLEVVFNAIEMADFLGRTGAIQQNKHADLKHSMVRLIAAVLERSQLFGFNSHKDLYDPTEHSTPHGGNVFGPNGYDELARLTKFFLDRPPRYDVSFMTFNYDIGLEYALMLRGVSTSYVIGDPTALKGHVPIFKLHGSVNWFITNKVVHVIPLPDIKSLSQTPTYWPHSIVGDARRMIISKHWPAANDVDICPYIVPPSEGKQTARSSLASTWKAACASLAQADYIVAIGYSIPRTDEFFRQLYAVASIDSAPLRKFYLIDKAADVNQQSPESLMGRYRQLIGPYSSSILKHLPGNMQQGLQALYSEHQERRGIL